MSHPLHHTFAGFVRAARASEPALEPKPALHALSYVVLLEAIGERSHVDPSDARALATLGEAALARVKLLSAGPLSEDDEDFFVIARPLAEAGLALLRGERVELGELPSEYVAPSPSRVLASLRGDLSGVEAGRLAARFLQRGESLLRDAHRARESLRGADEPALRLAAAPAESIRDPREGRRVLYDEPRGVEVVVFEDAVLAAYGEADVVTLEGEALEPILNRAGYALAKITSLGPSPIRAVVKVGDQSEIPFELRFPG